MSSPDVVIIGAGITGLSAALALAEKGVRVEVIERYRPAAMASGWTLAGVRQSGRHPAELPLAQSAIKLWKTIDSRLDAKTGYNQCGNLRLGRNLQESRVINSLVKKQKLAGLDIKLFDQRTLRKFAPSLSDKIRIASFCPTDGFADPIKTIEAFQNAAKRLGVKFKNGVIVKRIITKAKKRSFSHLETSGKKIYANTCLVAAGVHTNDLLKSADTKIPYSTPVVAAIRTSPLPRVITPVIGVANANVALKQQQDGKIMFTSGAEPFCTKITENSGVPVVYPPTQLVSKAIRTVSLILPAISETKVERVWGGLLDVTPDSLPIIDNVPGIDNLVIAAGFSGHGFGIGPATGYLLADLITGMKPIFNLNPFKFDRFKLQNAEKLNTEPNLHG